MLLKDILDKWNIAFSPKSFSTLFLAMQEEIKKILETAAFSAATSLPVDSSHTDDTLASGATEYQDIVEKKMVTNGIIMDDEIASLLFKAAPENGPILIAQGRESRYPKDARIRYHFPTAFRHAGRVRKDGSIDFSDRGEIPHVKEDTLLAFSNKEEPLPKVTVAGKIESRTQIFGAASAIILKRSYTKCHIQEILRNKEGAGGPPYHEIQIT